MLSKLYSNQLQPVLANMFTSNKYMPALDGLGLRDALYICEDAGLVVKINGAGKVINQSISAGSPIEKGQLIKLDLN